MVSYPTVDVIAACTAYGHMLKLPADLDGARVMLAIAAVESGGADPAHAGHDCGPRFEPAYFEGGGFYLRSPLQQQLVARHGRDAASSFGPWQMMFPNFSPGLSPQDLESLTICATQFVREFNHFADRWKFDTLDQIGEVWNTGREIPDPDYINKLQRAYLATALALSAPKG